MLYIFIIAPGEKCEVNAFGSVRLSVGPTAVQGRNSKTYELSPIDLILFTQEVALSSSKMIRIITRIWNREIIDGFLTIAKQDTLCHRSAQ